MVGNAVPKSTTNALMSRMPVDPDLTPDRIGADGPTKLCVSKGSVDHSPTPFVDSGFHSLFAKGEIMARNAPETSVCICVNS